MKLQFIDYSSFIGKELLIFIKRIFIWFITNDREKYLNISHLRHLPRGLCQGIWNFC